MLCVVYCVNGHVIDRYLRAPPDRFLPLRKTRETALQHLTGTLRAIRHSIHGVSKYDTLQAVENGETSCHTDGSQ